MRFGQFWVDAEGAARVREIDRQARKNWLLLDREWQCLVRDHPCEWVAASAGKLYFADDPEGLVRLLDGPSWIRGATALRLVPGPETAP
jgi:hypothetical protein